ncbi:UNVERIFIED_ORG: hypothetical protein J2Y93_002488 [Pantoea agglomerans]
MKKILIFLIIAIVSGCGFLKNGGDVGSARQPVNKDDVGVRSTLKQVTSWDKGVKFLNVIDSTDDPKINHQSWIALYKKECARNPGKKSVSGLVCAKDAIGGHVVKAGQSQYPKKGSTVYIAPICSSENNNPQIQMTIAENETCIVELNYLMKK